MHCKPLELHYFHVERIDNIKPGNPTVVWVRPKAVLEKVLRSFCSKEKKILDWKCYSSERITSIGKN